MQRTNADRMLLQRLNENVDSFDSYFDDSADEPIVAPSGMPAGNAGLNAQLGRAKGNPSFSAQFDVQILPKYFTLNGGAYTAIAASALNAALKNQLPFFLFGNSDFASGFTKLKSVFTLNTWVYGTPGIYGKDLFTPYAFDATVTGVLQNGDLLIPFTSALPGAGTTTLALIVVRCTQVAYGTLLASLSSDRFLMNMIRYVIPDTTKITQYSNNVGVFKQSLFGKFDSDYVSPNSYKKPEQLQNGIVDIPIKKGIDKNIAVASYANYDVGEIDLSIFVYSVKKLQAS